MPTIDDRTTNLSLAKPNVANTLQADVARLRSALDDIDAELVSLDNSNIAAGAEIAVSKLADGIARQLLQTDAAGTGVEWTSNVDLPGTLDVTGAATFDSAVTVPLGTAGAPAVRPVGSSTTGIFYPDTSTVAVSISGTERVRITSNGLRVVDEHDIWLQSADNTVEQKNIISWRIEDGSEGAYIAANREALSNAPHSVSIATRTSGGLVTEKLRVTPAGNLKIGGTADRATTEGTAQLVLFNGTAPVGTLANGVSLYSASGECRVMDAAGNSTLLSPHDRETNEWIYDSTDTTTGKRLRIDMEKMMKFLDAHFGLGYVQETFTT